MKRRLLLLLLIIYSPPSIADWFCKEATSKAMGNTFYACGHSLAKSLTEARENSLRAAKREFESFCSDSSNCKGNAYTMSPLRTDCTQVGESYSCHRGLEYTVLDKKNHSINIDRDELASRIEDKEMELTKLREDAAKVRHLEEVERKIKSMKSTNPQVSGPTNLKKDLPEQDLGIYSQGASLKIVGIGTPLKDDDTEKAEETTLGGLGTEYDINLWRAISARFSLSWIFGSDETKEKDRGLANSKSKTEFHSHSGGDGNFALPLTFGNFTFSPLIGYLTVSYKSTQYVYNEYGVGLEKIEKRYSYNSAYTGLGMRYGKKYFFELEPRKYFNGNKSSLAVSFGARFEF
jgi:hypothetical protein